MSAPRSRRLNERAQDLLSAVTQLEKALQQPEDEFVRDAIIQRFEFTYEMAWKTLQLRLEQEGVQTQTPRQALQESLAAGWIVDGSVWTEIQRNRNLTSHTYDEALASDVVQFVREHAIGQFQALRDKVKSW